MGSGVMGDVGSGWLTGDGLWPGGGRHKKQNGNAGAKPFGAKGSPGARLHVFVALAEHVGERLHFVFATANLARFLEVAFGADIFDDAFAFELLFQAAQRLVHGFAFANLDFYGHDVVWCVIGKVKGRQESIPASAVKCFFAFMMSPH
jgi:hypothetical protein